METRLRRDLYTKAFYAIHHDPNNTYDPTKPFIRSDWGPPNNLIPPELKSITSYFLCKIKDSFLNKNKRWLYCTTNLTRAQEHLLNELEASMIHIIIPADKNLGPVIMEWETYIKAVISLLQDKSTYKCLSQAEAKEPMDHVRDLTNKWLRKWRRYHLEEEEETFIERSINELNHVRDPYSHFYITAKVHQKTWKPRPLSATVVAISTS